MKLIDADDLKRKLQARHDNSDEDFDKGYNIGIETAIDLIDSALEIKQAKNICEDCNFRKFSENLADGIIKLMNDNDIHTLEELANICGVDTGERKNEAD